MTTSHDDQEYGAQDIDIEGLQGRKTVLIADDDPSIRKALERYFKAKGFMPIVAADGTEALKRVEQYEIEVALLDVNMPGLSGIDVLRQLRTDHPDIAVLLVTGVAEIDLAVEAMKIGAYDYITKPFNLDGLGDRVNKALKQNAKDAQRDSYQRGIQETVARQTNELRGMTTLTIQSLIAEESRIQGVKGSKRGRNRSSAEQGTQKFKSKILGRFLRGVCAVN